MSSKAELEKQRSKSQESSENVLISPKDQYQQLKKSSPEIGDPIITEILGFIDEKFDSLDLEAQRNVIQCLQDFFEALRNYKDSYDSLKYASRQERGVFYQDNVRGWQESIRNADKREKILHDKFLDSVNILSRTMKNSGLNNKWRGSELIYHHGGVNDSSGEIAREKTRQWMLRIYHEKFNSDEVRQ